MRSFIVRLLKIGLAIILVLVYMNVSAKVRLPHLIADNMVLQQRSGVLLWGDASVNTKIRIQTSWDGKKYFVRSGPDGKWKVTVHTPAAGGPYEITFDDGELLTLKNILIGEVWVCSGQSNMEIPVSGFPNQPVLNAGEILADAGNNEIRLFKVKHKISAEPLKDVEGRWMKDSAKNVRSFSAVGYQFAKFLNSKLHVPVGIIQSTWSGTNIISWMDEESMAHFRDAYPPENDPQKRITQKVPSTLFNGMINPLLNYKIKGVIWYQGEGNRNKPGIYAQLMKAMVTEWRRLWNNADWPFYYVQIAPWEYTSYANLVPYLREAQGKAMDLIPNSGMVVSIDAGSKYTIHPPDKTIISKRLAYWALAKAYGREGVAYRSPAYRSVHFKKGAADLVFDNSTNGFTSRGEDIRGFEVAGESRIFYPATAKIKGKGVSVYSENVKDPVAVRYCFKDWVKGNVYNAYGLPLAPFRTDNWPPGK